MFEAAKEAHVWGIGVDKDQYAERPEIVLTSMVKRVDTVVEKAVGDLVTKTLRGGIRAYGLADGGVDWVHAGESAKHLSPAVIEQVEALRKRVASGDIKVPSTLK